MFEDFLALTRQEVFQFTPVESIDDLPDLTAGDMWNLCDIAVRFGVLHQDGFGRPSMFFPFKTLRVDVYNFTGNGMGGTAGMMIGKHRPGRDFQSTEEGAFMPVLLNGMLIIWDRGHTVRTVQRYIHEIDNYAYANGLVVAGRRIII